MRNVYEKYVDISDINGRYVADTPTPEMRALLDSLPKLTRIQLGIGNTLPRGEGGIWRRVEIADTYAWRVIGNELHVIVNGELRDRKDNRTILRDHYNDTPRTYYYRPLHDDRGGRLAVHDTAGPGTVSQVTVEPVSTSPYRIIEGDIG